MPATLLTRIVLAAATIATAGHAASAASAATVETDRECYLQRTDTRVAVRGLGFTPGAPFDVVLDGEKLQGGASTMDADGAMAGTFTPPTLGKRVVQRRFRLGLTTADAAPTTQFTVTRLLASFWPAQGSAAKLRVRFSLFGFGIGGPVDQAYVHYVAPTGHFVKTVALGRPAGQCGAIPKTAKRRLFPFARTCPGSWQLQFDTRKRYSPGSTKSSFLYYLVRVQVKTPKSSRASVARSPACRAQVS